MTDIHTNGIEIIHYDGENIKVLSLLKLAFGSYISCNPGQNLINLELNKLTIVNICECLYVLHEVFSAAFN